MIADSIERLNLTFSAGAVALAWAVAPAPFATGLSVGVVLEAANFRALRGGAQRFFSGELAGSAPAVAAFGLRFALLAGVLVVAMRAGCHPVGLVVGLSLIVPAAVLGAWLERPMPATAATDLPAPPPPDDVSWDEWNPWLARERVREPEEEE